MDNFQPLEVADRGSDTQLQVVENLNKLTQQDKSSDPVSEFMSLFVCLFVNSGIFAVNIGATGFTIILYLGQKNGFVSSVIQLVHKD